MAGQPVYGQDYYEDAKRLLERGLSKDRVAARLGMSRATLYRLLDRYGGSR